MITRKTWQEFRDSGLLWWINRLLHTFGWAIVVVVEQSGEVTAVYPARVKCRGFAEKDEDEGFVKLTKYLEDNLDDIKRDL